MSYVFVEYPKCLYNQDGGTLVVNNREEEDDSKQFGWSTAEEHHTQKHESDPSPSKAAEPAKPQFPWRQEVEGIVEEGKKVEDGKQPEVAHDGPGSDHKIV